jgi:hypothetical protein
MLVIDHSVFHPIEGDSEFKVTLRPLSFVVHSEIKMLTAGKESVGVERDLSPEEIREKEKNNLEFIRLLFDKAVVKVEGCVCADKEITTGQELIEIAPPFVVEGIAGKIISLLRPKDAEIKN